MTIRVRCPECNAEYALADSVAGKKVRCKKCEGVIPVKAAPEADSALPAKRRAAVQAEPPRRDTERRNPAKDTARPRRPREDDEDGDTPPIKRKSNRVQKKSSLALPLILGGAGLALLLVLACGGVGVFLLFGHASAPSAPAASTPAVAQAPALPVDNPGPAPAAAPPAAQPPAVADNTAFHLGDVRKSVVFIRRSTPGQPGSTGTGFLVTKEGLIATNRHVVQSATGPNPATVLYVGVPSAADPDVLDYFKGQVAFVAPTQDTLDFALVKITPRPGYQALRPLPLATTKLDLGAPAAVVGYPFARVDNPVLSFNKGSISATRVAIEDRPYYQTDAAVNPGNSGGPMINTDGQVVGIVSRKMDDANNMGFALYLGETGLPSVLNQEQVARAQSEAGPLDPKLLPASSNLTPTHLANWDKTRGDAVEEKGVVIAENGGSSYWLTYKTPLPENFQLKIECYVVAVLPRRQRPGFGPGFGPPLPFLPQAQVNMAMLRSLYVRFGTDAVVDDILSMSGTTVHLSAAQTQVAESGVVVSTTPKGVPSDPFVLTVTRRGDELTLMVNDEVLATQKLKASLQGAHKFSIGGFQSALLLHAATVAPVDGPPVPPPVAVAPPQPAPAGPPAVLSFDAGWDKPVDPDGDCKIVSAKNSLTIEAPAKRHDLVGEGVLNAPRLLRDVTGEFTAQVKVTGDFQPAAPATGPLGLPYVGAGLLVIVDDRTFLRLERASMNRDGVIEPVVNWEVRANGQQQWSGVAKLNPEDQTVYLRLRRQGGRFFPSFSRDNEAWTDLPAQDANVPLTVKVGAAVVTTSSMVFKPRFDDFRLGGSGAAPPVVDKKLWAVKPPADWKGPEWTTDLDKMKLPDAPASGWLMGADFKLDEASINPIGWLTLRQGKQFDPAGGGDITIMLSQKSLRDLEGKTITISGKQAFPAIFCNAGRTLKGEPAKLLTFPEYTMKLEFGKGEGLKLPGKIYICFPDEAKSVIAGKFVLDSK